MAELERIANHVGDIGAICNDASFTLNARACGVLRERVSAPVTCRVRPSIDDDRVVPGGWRIDPSNQSIDAVRRLVDESSSVFRHSSSCTFTTRPSLQDRRSHRRPLRRPLAAQYAAGDSSVARRPDIRLRRALPYAPYDALTFRRSSGTLGDVNDGSGSES